MATLNKDLVKLGIAPIGWTNDDMPELGAENTFQQTISEMALAGFKGSEVGGHYPTDKYELKKALDLRDMVICNQWFSSFLLTKPYEEVEKEFVKQCDFLDFLVSLVLVHEVTFNVDVGDSHGFIYMVQSFMHYVFIYTYFIFIIFWNIF